MTEPPLGPAGRCPGAEELAALAAGQADGATRTALADHVVACPACAADFRLLRELHAEASRQRRAWRGPRVAVLAAGLAAALAVVVLAPSLLREAPDGLRGEVAAVRPPDGSVLEAAPETLAWEADADARGYRVRLFRDDATLAWESGALAVAAAPLPAEVRNGMTAGQSWYWTVENLGPARRRTMGPFWFQVRGP